MKKTNSTDIVELFTTFQQRVLLKKPASSQMVQEVRMMQFKVRPVSGNIASMDFENLIFIEALWSLGKLDEFFHETVKNLKKSDKQLFFKLFDSLYQDYQGKLNQVSFKTGGTKAEREEYPFEVEIYRDRGSQKN